MLCATALVPASPLLVPTLHKVHAHEVERTTAALHHLADRWYVQGIEHVVVITASRFAYPHALALDVADPYVMNLSELGDASAPHTYHPNIHIIDALQRAGRRQGIPLTLTSEASLPFGCAAILRILEDRIKGLRIVPLFPAKDLDAKTHYRFGNVLRNVLEEMRERTAILVAEDISLTDMQRMEHILQEKSIAALTTLNNETEPYLGLTILFGAQEQTACINEILSIESPFEMGYVVATCT